MSPDPKELLEVAGIRLPLLGFYDAPDPKPFEPLVSPAKNSGLCSFAFFPRWMQGETLHLTREAFGCAGAGHSLCSVEMRSTEDLVKFLVDQEGLKASRELMTEWVTHTTPYRQRHEHILIGPFKSSQYEHLRTVTFWVNPDQLGLLALGAQYHARPTDPPPVLAPFGSGCGQLVTLFRNLDHPQAVIGATDIAMRQHLPPDTLAFTVTKPLFEQLCSLDKKSFLYKPFWKNLVKARAGR